MSDSHRVLVTDPIHAAGIARLKEAPGIELVHRVKPTPEELAEVLPGIAAWIVRSGTKIRAEHFERATSLKVVARAGVGVDNVDVTAATLNGVLVMNAPDANAITTAELSIAHLLSLSRHLVEGDRMVRRGEWKRSELVGTEVEGKMLGVIGLGRIGRRVAEKARGLGMSILGHDPYVNAEAVRGLDIELCELPDLLARSDYISLHAPLTDGTRHLLNRESLAAARPGLRVINCARGALIDDDALLEALDQGRVAAAALDVFQSEPPDPENPLLKHPKVVVTPHLGASTEEASQKVSLAVVNQVLDYFAGRRIINAVNLPPVSGEAWEELAPFMALARQTGRFLSQTLDWPVQAIRAEYRGEIAERDTRPLTLSFLQGLLTPLFDRPVNLVNAQVLADERGMSVSESTSTQPRDFSSLLCFEADTPTGTRKVGSALFGRRMLRIVLLDDTRLELMPEGHLFVLRNQDVPGVIGKVGTMLGAATVNIGNMHVSGPAEDGLCYAVLAVSERIPDDLLDQVLALPEIDDARRVDLT